MTATVTTWHRVRVCATRTVSFGWVAWCRDCDWSGISFGPGAWQSAVGKALAHVDETKEET